MGGVGAYFDIHPFLLGKSLILVHQDSFGHRGTGEMLWSFCWL